MFTKKKQCMHLGLPHMIKVCRASKRKRHGAKKLQKNTLYLKHNVVSVNPPGVSVFLTVFQA